MLPILWAFLVLAGLGLLFGLGLAIASKVFYVKEDNRIEEVAKMLPNANCGSCGYAGCKGFAAAIVKGEAGNLSKCRPGKLETTYNPILEYLKDHPNDDGTPVNIKI